MNRLRGRVYEHSVIVHQHNFVDPNDSEIHTQNIENMWMRAKRKLKRHFSTSRALFPTHLNEFSFRSYFAGEDLFAAFSVTSGDNNQ